jgi:hypothetical protein
MPNVTLAPLAILEISNLSGTVSDIQDDPASPDGNWLTAQSNNSNSVVRTSFNNSPGPMSGTQNFRALVRKFGGTGTPTARIELWGPGGLIIGSNNVSITGSQVISFEWGSSFIPNGGGVELRVVGVASGGGPTVRATIEVGALAWDVSYEAQAPSDGTLTVQDAQHAHTSDNVTLAQAHILTAQDTSHPHTADNVVLVSGGAGASLVVQDTTHPHRADNVSLTGSETLTVQDAAHLHRADNVVLTQAHFLVIQDAAHPVRSDNVSLVASETLVIQDAAHRTTSDNGTLTQAHFLVIQDTRHPHTGDNVTLTQAHFLVIQDTTHLHRVQSLALAQTHILEVQDTTHPFRSSEITLGDYPKQMVLVTGTLTTRLEVTGEITQALGVSGTITQKLEVKSWL